MTLRLGIYTENFDTAQPELLALVNIDCQICGCAIVVELNIGKGEGINVPLGAVEASKFFEALGDFLSSEDVTPLHREKIAPLLGWEVRCPTSVQFAKSVLFTPINNPNHNVVPSEGISGHSHRFPFQLDVAVALVLTDHTNSLVWGRRRIRLWAAGLRPLGPLTRSKFDPALEAKAGVH